MKDTFYFKHDYNARGDDRIINLRRDLGMEGYGIYWALVEKLYESGGRIAANFDAIAFDLATDAVKVKSVATKFGLFYFAGASRCLASKAVDRRLQERREKSEKARQSAYALHRPQKDESSSTEKDANAQRTHANAQRTHARRGEERREEKITAASPPSAAGIKAEINRLAHSKSPPEEGWASDEDLLATQLPFAFGDIPKGRTVIDVDSVSAQAILDQVPRLGFRIERALRLRIKLKREESNQTV